MMKKLALPCLLCLSLGLPSIAKASLFNFNEVGISYGHGIDVENWTQVDFIQHISPSLGILEEYFKEPFLDLGIATSQWKVSRDVAYHISSNLMLRSQDISTGIGNIFLEAGFGPHLFSKPGGTGRLATAFEFNSFAGLGFRLNQHWAVVARARHLSNAGITDSNSGVNLYLLQLHYRFNQP
ncbi:MAG: acyloxyacyl hydrolase [Ghiorsea sp.]|nr:acyloxyacyl hydrolase [Ghiorsea sp.]